MSRRRGLQTFRGRGADRFELLTDSGVDAFVERVRTRAHYQGAV